MFVPFEGPIGDAEPMAAVDNPEIAVVLCHMIVIDIFDQASHSCISQPATEAPC